MEKHITYNIQEDEWLGLKEFLARQGYAIRDYAEQSFHDGENSEARPIGEVYHVERGLGGLLSEVRALGVGWIEIIETAPHLEEVLDEFIGIGNSINPENSPN